MESSHQEINWHWLALPRATKKALDFLSNQKWLKQSRWYLAGGTALALQCGHRRSVDLDFFTPQADFSTDKLLSHFKSRSWETTSVREGTVYGTLLGAKVSFIAYPFFVPIEPPLWHGSVRILHARDIAVMKIIAISQRGRKRDFFDLYWYVTHREPLLDVVARLKKQYPTVAHNYHHIAKSLVYFDDAGADVMPRLRFRATWNQVKKYFKKEVGSMLHDLMKLGW